MRESESSYECVRGRGTSRGGASLSVSLGDGALCNPAGCCAHGARGICRGLCVWPEHRCVLAATLVGRVRGMRSRGLPSFPVGVPPSSQPAVPGPSPWGQALPLLGVEAAKVCWGKSEKKVKMLVTQCVCLLCDPMDCSLPGSSVHGNLQARILEWVAMPHSRDLPTQGLNPGLPCCRWILYHLSHQGSPRILEWVAYPFSRGSSHPGIKPRSPTLQADFSLSESPGKYKHFYCLTLFGPVLVLGNGDPGVNLTQSLSPRALSLAAPKEIKDIILQPLPPGPCFQTWSMTSSCSTSMAQAWRPSSTHPTSSSPSFREQAPWASPLSAWSESQSRAVPEAQKTSGVRSKRQSSPPKPARGHP